MTIKIDYLRDKPEALNLFAPLLFKIWGHHQSEPGLAGRYVMMERRKNGRTIPTCVVASDQTEILGTASLVDCDCEARRDLSPWLATVYVLEHARGKGVGSQLVTFIENEARLLGMPKIYLITPDKESFYTRLGWRTIERLDNHGDSSFVMEKSL